MNVIDLTHTIVPTMPAYPGTEPPSFTQANTYEDDGFKETLLSMYSHTGTHVDPPAHLFADGATLDALPASHFVGRAVVVDCRHLNEGDAITMQEVSACGPVAGEADFLLFNLGWDKRWGTQAYYGDYPCINDDVLNFIVETGKKGIGFDVIGLDPIADENLTRHKKLFAGREIINIENLANLDLCGNEPFWFFALPLKWEHADGAPVRALAFWEE